jgi:hypothetical protein
MERRKFTREFRLEAVRFERLSWEAPPDLVFETSFLTHVSGCRQSAKDAITAPTYFQSHRSLRSAHLSPKSHCDLRADLDHAIGRNLEIIGRVVGTARQTDEQPILPARHAGTHGKPECAPREEE